jgi:hypothetical protein
VKRTLLVGYKHNASGNSGTAEPVVIGDRVAGAALGDGNRRAGCHFVIHSAPRYITSRPLRISYRLWHAERPNCGSRVVTTSWGRRWLGHFGIVRKDHRACAQDILAAFGKPIVAISATLPGDLERRLDLALQERVVNLSLIRLGTHRADHMTLKIVREQWRRVIFMQTNREDVGKRYLEISIPVPPNRTRAGEVSEPSKSYYETIAQARSALQGYLQSSKAHHFFVSGAEAPELTDDDAAPLGGG